MNTVSGFSKLSKLEKIHWLSSQVDSQSSKLVEDLTHFWHPDEKIQKKFDEFSENTLTNFNLPFGIAPNFLINGKIYAVPMVIEESSVVAAASLGAKFWLERGGFKATVHSEIKVGQIHFTWTGSGEELSLFFSEIRNELMTSTTHLTENMIQRGGGITYLELIDCTDKLKHYWQIRLEANTCNAMGANFINSLLEELAKVFKSKMSSILLTKYPEEEFEIIMCILSNYTPECLVEVSVECPVEELGDINGMPASEFAKKFVTAVNIAQVDVSRAVTHNKGIMNGVDAVVIATGNDFRAIEASAHAYASRDGRYRSLSRAEVENGIFKFSLKLPLAVGTTGGLTSLHPVAKASLAILNSPSASELMMIMASVGLSQNFGAVRSLVTTGIQKGHMKLHLLNILNQLGATSEQRELGKIYFSDKIVSFTAVRNFLNSLNHSQ
jgi:hydroxymethylglutaryl-CoA reductase